MFDPEYTMTLYFNGDEALTQADMDQLSEWIGQSHENASKYLHASFLHRAIYESLVGSDIKKNVLLDLNEATNCGYDVVMDSNVSLKGVDVTEEVLSNEKEDSLAGIEVSLDSSIMQALRELSECEKNAPAVEVVTEEQPRELIREVVYPPKEKRKVSKFQIFTLVISAAAIIIFAFLLEFAPDAVPSVEVATVTDQMNVQWAQSSIKPKNGERLLTKDWPLDLKKGLVSIEFDQGVEVVVEGPAVFEIQRMGIYLESGRLYSKVSEGGMGFTVSTANSEFVDMGTEFGVEAENNGSSELHVTKGKVQLFAGSKGSSRLSQMVTENKAMRYDAVSGRVKSIPIQRKGFVRKIDSAKNLVWGVSSDYEKAVKRSEPLYYWRFEEDEPLRDEMAAKTKEESRLLGSVGFGDGPIFGGGKNGALRLTGLEEDYAVLRNCTIEADECDSFSMAMWVYPEEQISASSDAIIAKIRKENGEGLGNQTKLKYESDGRFTFSVLCRDNAGDIFKTTMVKSSSFEINQWYHVVVSYTNSGMAKLYVNGQLEASGKMPSAVGELNFSRYQPYWCLGSGVFDPKGTFRAIEAGRVPDVSFKGLIDEVSQYDRELSASEVEMLYNSGSCE